MMQRFVLAVLTATCMFTSACAQEEQTNTVQDKTQIQGKTQAQTGSAQVAKLDKSVSQQVLPATEAKDWRTPDPENTLYIKTKYGTFVVEMYPEVAPKHVAQIKKLARMKFYNDITFHRVIKDFMNQTGDPRGDGTGNSSLPDIPGEMIFRRSPTDMKMTVIGQDLSPMGEVDTGFYKALPIGSKPSGQAWMTKDGKVDAFGMHCKGVASMARGSDINSANSQFFLMRAAYPSLNAKYTVWGTTVWGRDGLTKIKVGTVGETPNFIPDTMDEVKVAADVPEKDRIPVQILRTDSKAFEKYVETLKQEAGKYPGICDIEVPTRLKK